MAAPSRPGVDVRTRWDATGWRELVAESLRAHGHRTRLGLAALGVLVIAGVAVALRADPLDTAVLTAGGLLAVGAYGLAVRSVGPRLRWPRLDPAALEVRWRVDAEGLVSTHAGEALRVPWPAVRHVVVGRHVLVLVTRDGRVFGAPRSALTGLGESLVTGWAADAGVDVVHRQGPLRG